MLFRQLFDMESCSYTYLIADNKSREAIIIDPVLEKIDLYLKLINELQLKLIIATDTHVHADHVTATGMLKRRTNCQIAMSRESEVKGADIYFQDKDDLHIGNLKITALHTPGHTNCSYSFLMNDRVFTGDTLSIRGTGRTDFQSGNPRQAYDSLFNKLLKLPPEIQVYPGHDYQGITVSTIGEEIRYNPRLQVHSVEEYVEIMNNLNLPPPKKIDKAVPANRKCGLDEIKI